MRAKQRGSYVAETITNFRHIDLASDIFTQTSFISKNRLIYIIFYHINIIIVINININFYFMQMHIHSGVLRFAEGRALAYLQPFLVSEVGRGLVSIQLCMVYSLLLVR